jgi:hypothetical protein
MSIPFQCNICKGTGIAANAINLAHGNSTKIAFCYCDRGDVVIEQHKLDSLLKGKEMSAYVQVSDPRKFDDYD